MNPYPRGIAVLSLLLTGLISPAPAQTERRESEETIQARYEHWLNKRLDENGDFSMNAVLRAKAETDARRVAGPLRRATTPGGWNWEWLGPGNIGGRIECILINPFNTELRYIGSPGGGIWRTLPRTYGWLPVNDFLPILNVVSLTIDPLYPDNMYAGTGEYEYMGGYGSPSVNGRNITGVGIFKSTDGGSSWFQLPSTNNSDFNYVSRLDHYPASTNRLVAGTATGLWRSSDGGTNWVKILAPDSSEPVRDVKINPANPYGILVGTTRDVYLTFDGAYKWYRQTTGAPGKMPVSPGRCELAIAPTNTNVMYVSIALRYGGDRLWRTTDGGTTWQLRQANTLRVNSYTNAIWVSPTDPNFILVGGTDSLSRSTDGGGSFVGISDWRGYHNGRTTPGFSPHGDFHAIVSHPNYDGVNNKTVYVGDDGGIQYTSDITTVSKYSGWRNYATNLGITQFYGGAASPDGSVIVGGTQDLYNVNYYANTVAWGPYGGVNGWWNFIYGDGGYAAIDYTNSNNIYVEAQDLGFDRSTDGGTTYSPARNGLHDAGNGRSLFVAPFVMHPTNPAILVAGGMSIWRTVNGAASWDSIRPPVAGSPRCSAIEFYKANPGMIWVGYENGLVSYTNNSGLSWNDAGKPGGNRFVTDIAVNPTAQPYAEVIVTVGGYSGNNVWLSTDHGATWLPRTGVAPDNLPKIQVNTVRYHPLQPNRVYVGTDLGVFASTDKGVHWNVAPQSLNNEGPANTPVEELFWQGTTYLIAATHGRGMFRVNPLIVSVPEDDGVPAEFSLEQNYPNPFNPVTTIKYTVGGSGVQTSGAREVRLAVYDILGRQVAMLVNEKKAPGNYEVKFDGSGLASGVYFYRLTAGDFTVTKKLALVR